MTERLAPFAPRRIKQLAYSVQLICVFASLYTAYSLVLFFVPQSLPTSPSTINSVGSPHHAPISNHPPAPLFGHAIPRNEDRIPATLLNFHLVGVLNAGNEQHSHVVIQQDNGQEQIYLLNQRLPGGAKLIRILDNAALIEYQGHVERLSLKRDTLAHHTIEPLEITNDYS